MHTPIRHTARVSSALLPVGTAARAATALV